MSEINLNTEKREEILAAIDEHLKTDISFVADLMERTSRHIQDYMEQESKRANDMALMALHDLLSILTIEKLGRMNKNFMSFIMPAVYLLNPNGLCKNNAPTVQEATIAFCDLAFPDRCDSQRAREAFMGIDLEPLYIDWLRIQGQK